MTTEPNLALADEIERILARSGDWRRYSKIHELAPAQWDTIVTALRRAPRDEPGEITQTARDFQAMLMRIAYRHRKGLDLTKTLEGALNLVKRKGDVSPFRAPAQPEESARADVADRRETMVVALERCASGETWSMSHDAMAEIAAELRASISRADALTRLQAERVTDAARIAELERGLKPFAEFISGTDPSWDDRRRIATLNFNFDKLTLGIFRKAASLLRNEAAGGKNGR